MKFRFKPLLISSMTLLLMQTVTAQPVSISEPFSLEQGLNLSGLGQEEQSLSNHLALMGNEMKWPSGITSLQQQFQQQYRKQKSKVINDPDDEISVKIVLKQKFIYPTAKAIPSKELKA